MTEPAAIPTLRFGILLWAAGMVGSAAITTMVLPQLLQRVQAPLPAPIWVISFASLVQSALLLALAVWAGVRFTSSRLASAHRRLRLLRLAVPSDPQSGRSSFPVSLLG